MAAPTALFGLACFAAVLTQARGSPYWSQPDCPDQAQGVWTGSSYENQGPSYQQTLQEMVSETIRCIQQVIQVTKREMALLLSQLTQDSDCDPSGVDDVTPGAQLPPPDGGYNYDRPQVQLQYPEDRPNQQSQVQTNYQSQLIPQTQYLPVGQPEYYNPPSPVQEPPQVPPQSQVQVQDVPQTQAIEPPGFYEPVPIQPMPQDQPDFIPDIGSLHYPDAVNCKYHHGKLDHSQLHVATSTVENRIFFPTTVAPSSANVDSASPSPQPHTDMVERPIIMKDTKITNSSSESVKTQPGNVLTSTISSSLIIPSNTTVLPQSDSTYFAENVKKIYEDNPDFNTTNTQPVVVPNNVTKNEDSSAENALNKSGSKEENNSIPPNNSSDIDALNIPLLFHGSPISLPTVINTTARSNNTIDNHEENNITVPSPKENEVDAIMENMSDANGTNNENVSSGSETFSSTTSGLQLNNNNNSAIEQVTTELKDVSVNVTTNPTNSDTTENVTTPTTEVTSSAQVDITTDTTAKYNDQSMSTASSDLTSPKPLDETSSKNLSTYAVDTSNNSVQSIKTADAKPSITQENVTTPAVASEQSLNNHNSNTTTPLSTPSITPLSSASTDRSTSSSKLGSTLSQSPVTESTNSSTDASIITRKAKL